MSTIYDRSFINNLSRLTDLSKKSGKINTSQADNQNQFKTILADLEPKKVEENKIVNKEQNDTAKGNTEAINTKNIVLDLNNKIEIIPSVMKSEQGQATIEPVKFSGLDVKTTTANPIQIRDSESLDKLINTKTVPVSQPIQRVEEQIGDLEKKDPIKDYKNIIATAGKYYGIDPNLGLAVAQAESSFDPKAVSKDGYESKGLFQLLDSTAGLMKDYTGLEDKYDPFDPAQNTYLGVGYLRRLHDLFSSENNLGFNIKTQQASSAEDLEKLAVAAFNAGEGSVAKAQQQAQEDGKDPTLFSSIEEYLPKSTRGYVEKVSQLKENFLKESKKNKIS